MSRGPTVRRCSCGVKVREAVTGSGLSVVVDVGPLSPAGELSALLAGVSTYTWHTWAQELHHRSPSKIRSTPAGTRARQDVLPLHRCGRRWQALPPPPTAETPPPGDDTPPF